RQPPQERRTLRGGNDDHAGVRRHGAADSLHRHQERHLRPRRIEAPSGGLATGEGRALRELHHRIKNNLQLVLSLVRLSPDADDSGECEVLRTDLARRIISIAQVHELFYDSESFTEIDFAVYLHRLVDSIGDTPVGAPPVLD
ncbi:MAG: hypothetical protein HC888_10050, partial [Candidatus Competibacteraceae bacterium]|nr:hypothetical protein [Candidatus Competibacteraceae bacterium]